MRWAVRIPDDKPLTAGEFRQVLREAASEILRDRGMGYKNRKRHKQKTRRPRGVPAIDAMLEAGARVEREFVDDQRIYVIGARNHPVKVGIAIDVEKRLSELQTGNPHKLRIFAKAYAPVGYRAREIEGRVHRALASCHTHGEWFDVTPDEAEECLRHIIDNLRPRTTSCPAE